MKFIQTLTIIFAFTLLSNSIKSEIIVCEEKYTSSDVFCTEEYKPVCGFLDSSNSDCNDGDCYKDYGNDCQACTSGVYKAETELSCDEYFSQSTSTTTNNGTSSGSNSTDLPISDRVVCSEEYPSKEGISCTEEFRNLCGIWDPNQCKGDNCYKDYGNACQACTSSDPVIEVLNDKSCKEYLASTSSSVETISYVQVDKHECTDKDRSDACSTKYQDAVCFTQSSCNSENTKDCQEQFKNICEACKKTDVDVVVVTTCDNYNYILASSGTISEPNETETVTNINTNNDEKSIDEFLVRHRCSDPTKMTCSEKDSPVCGFKNDCNPLKEECYKSYNNECEACLDNAYEISYASCPEQKKCDGSEKICTMEFTSSCSKLKKCNETTGECFSQIGGTKCQNCSSGNFEYVIEGKSCYELQPLINIYYSEETDALDDGTTKERETAYDLNTITTSLLSVTAESTVNLRYDAYICQESDKNNTCSSTGTSVCGYKTCTSGICPYSYTNLCQACLDSELKYLVKSECSSVGFARVVIPCSTEEKASNCTTTSKVELNVCGIYSQNSNFCLGTECGESFTNNCDACAKTDITSYYQGSCNASSNLAFSLIILIIALFSL